MATNWLTPSRWWISLVVASAIVVVISIAMSRSYIGHRSLDMDESGRISECQLRMLKAMRPQPQTVDVSLLGTIYSMCYQEASQEDTLEDFGIRKSAYLNQQVQTPILLWMVVGITLSGVLLAALQLVAAYRLATNGEAAFDQGGQVSIEHGKFSLSSSVTGILILSISLAFFMVFVSRVYLIQETHSQVDAPATRVTFPATVGWAAQTAAAPQQRGGSPAAITARLGGVQEPSRQATLKEPHFLASTPAPLHASSNTQPVQPDAKTNLEPLNPRGDNTKDPQ